MAAAIEVGFLVGEIDGDARGKMFVAPLPVGIGIVNDGIGVDALPGQILQILGIVLVDGIRGSGVVGTRDGAKTAGDNCCCAGKGNEPHDVGCRGCHPGWGGRRRSLLDYQGVVKFKAMGSAPRSSDPANV